MFRPKGYYVGASYVGILPGNWRMLFSTESEYLDYLREHYEDVA